MINIYPSYYKQFRCIADKCPDTCCAKWEIVVDENSANFYKGIKTPFGDILKASMQQDLDGDTVFINRDNRCPFLNNNNLCDIYINLGEGALCQTCSKYPRFSTSFGGTTEWGLSLSCPAACELILENDLELVSEFNDADPDLNDLDADLYLYLKEVRGALFKNPRSISEILSFAKEVEKNYKNKSYIVPDFNNSEKADFNTKIFSELEYLTEQGRDIFLNLNSIKEIKLNSELKRVLDYYIYRYLLASVYDGDLSFPFNLACFAVVTIAALNEKMPLSKAAVLFSKEIEHSASNISLLRNKVLDN